MVCFWVHWNLDASCRVSKDPSECTPHKFYFRGHINFVFVKGLVKLSNFAFGPIENWKLLVSKKSRLILCEGGEEKKEEKKGNIFQMF